MNRLLFLSIISIVIISGEALNCYECKFCDDVTTTKNIVERNCTGLVPNPVCYKMDYVLSNDTAGVQSRGCISLDKVYSASLRANNSGVYARSMAYHFCNTDLCNNSESLYSTSTIIFITIVTFICAIKNIY